MKRALGFTIVEVVLGVLLAAIIVQGVLVAILSSHQKVAKSDTRTVATAYAKRLMDELGNYVVPPDPNNAANPAPGTVGLSPSGCSWNIPLPGNACPVGWALTDGNYDLWAMGYTNFLPAPWQAQHNAGLSYTVSTQNVNGQPMKKVTVTVTWQTD